MTRRTIWIAGGTDKGNDYEVLKPLVREKVAALVCMGVDNSKLLAAFGDTVEQIVSTTSLDEAMEAARRLAKEGDTVLLSPACASFDLFKNYEQRGKLFKEWVARHAER
jgi:UDP-N-acetylmuramoylalanine--D-glutamate ligase